MLIRYGVWAVLTVVFLAWEITAFLVRGGSLAHPTLSAIVKRWEGVDPASGMPKLSPAGIARRSLIAAGLLALFLHWVVQAF